MRWKRARVKSRGNSKKVSSIELRKPIKKKPRWERRKSALIRISTGQKQAGHERRSATQKREKGRGKKSVQYP